MKQASGLSAVNIIRGITRAAFTKGKIKAIYSGIAGAGIAEQIDDVRIAHRRCQRRRTQKVDYQNNKRSY